MYLKTQCTSVSLKTDRIVLDLAYLLGTSVRAAQFCLSTPEGFLLGPSFLKGPNFFPDQSMKLSMLRRPE